MATSFEFQTGQVEFKSSGQGAVDSSLPVFGGIVSATPTINGSIIVTWNTGTTTKNPLRYEIYIALGSVSAATLFSTDLNVVKIVGDTVSSTAVVTLADQTTYIVNGSQYTLGVKAVDAFGYENGPASVIVVTAISSGNIGSIFQSIATSLSATEALLATDHTNLNQDHINLNQDHTNLASDITALTTQIGLLTTQVSDITVQASSLNSSATSFSANLTIMSSYLSTLSTDLSTLGGYVSQIGVDVSALNIVVSDLNAAILAINNLESSLQSIVTELAGSAGTALLTDLIDSDLGIDTVETLLDVEILEELP